MSQRSPLAFLLAFSIIFSFAYHLHALASKCALDMQIPSSWNDANDVGGDWCGFLKNKSCGLQFDRYLYAIGKKANQTGEIFLNATEQLDCSKDFVGCGVDRLTSGAARGCSDYTVTDVMNNLGVELGNLDEDCKKIGSGTKFDDEGCISCLERWRNMAGSVNNSHGLTREEADVCRFSVLVSFTSIKISDVGQIKSIYNCLGNGIPIDDQASGGRKISRTTGLVVLIVGVAGIVIVAVISMTLFNKSTKKKPTTETEARSVKFSQESSSVKISIKEMYLATDNLSAANLIGQGVAGKVYKGVLSDGQRVAVKHIINDGHMETFVREVTSLSHVKHPNLVALLGHCDGEDESFLVYELCDNGNLSEWLFGKHKILTWIQRLEIAIDCARGLWFLHTYPEGCIVHRDIKPTNILLGANFQAKLSDFGLSKVISMGVSYVSSEVRGTFGYVDPEYQKNCHVHSSTDVYSFGIVLLQLISGQRVVNLDVTKPVSLSKMAKNLRRGGDVTEMADPKLNGEYSDEAFELIFMLALSCTGLKQQRPSMEKVVGVLEKAHKISQRMKCLTDPSSESFHSTEKSDFV